MQIRLQKVNVMKQRKDEESACILKNIDLEIKNKEILCVVGPSGSGKSTLLRTLNRLEEITSGDILFDGRSIFDIPPRSLRKQVGMVLQTPSLFDASVYENVVYGLKLQQVPEDEQIRQAEEIIALVGLDKDLLTREALSLSIGQQQRVSIARTLVNQPEVLLLDEITSALDPKSTDIIEQLLLDIHDRSNKTLVIVTHSMELANKLAHRITLIINGEIIEVNEKKNFFSQPKHQKTKEFIASFTGVDV